MPTECPDGHECLVEPTGQHNQLLIRSHLDAQRHACRWSYTPMPRKVAQ